MTLFLNILELFGTVAFALSGAMVGIQKRLDLLGVVFLGVVTAVGGGVLRDLMIGVTPPRCFQDPVYLLVACAASLLFFLPFLRRPLMRHEKTFDRFLFTTDSLGLAVFTVSGVQAGYASSPSFGPVRLVFIGMLTGTGGGVLRDILADETPYIFQKHVYATASLAGAVLFVVCHRLNANWYVSWLASIGLVFLIRCLASHYKWNLPRATE